MLHVVHLVLWLDELLLRDDDCEQDLKGRPLAVSCTSLSSLSPQKFLRGGGWWWWRTPELVEGAGILVDVGAGCDNDCSLVDSANGGGDDVLSRGDVVDVAVGGDVVVGAKTDSSISSNSSLFAANLRFAIFFYASKIRRTTFMNNNSIELLLIDIEIVKVFIRSLRFCLLQI